MVDVHALAAALDDAARDVRAIPKLTARTPLDVATAYAVQRAGIERRRRRASGSPG
ncbi:hypothetical protein ACFQY7_15090 [Actinomadura luteofluorescens]|uniref:hypothetical protein n=1 Tax=Actinomadura luteofluorescens TaxID=46163 RepID=UPI003625DC0C